MYTRSAMFEGRIHTGREDQFYRLVETELMPIWHRMPGALAVRAYRPERRDDDAREIFLMQELDYASLEAVEAAMASPVRLEGREATMRLMKLCDGHFSHLVSVQLGGGEPW